MCPVHLLQLTLWSLFSAESIDETSRISPSLNKIISPPPSIASALQSCTSMLSSFLPTHKANCRVWSIIWMNLRVILLISKIVFIILYLYISFPLGLSVVIEVEQPLARVSGGNPEGNLMKKVFLLLYWSVLCYFRRGGTRDKLFIGSHCWTSSNDCKHLISNNENILTF